MTRYSWDKHDKTLAKVFYRIYIYPEHPTTRIIAEYSFLLSTQQQLVLE